MVEAVQEKLLRERQRAVLAEVAGSLNLADYPEWQTPAGVSSWVHDKRVADDAHAARERAGQ